MKTIQYGSEQYEEITMLGMGAGFSYNHFNQMVNQAMEAVRQMTNPSKAELDEVRAIYERAQAADLAFQEACEEVQVVGDQGNFELLKQVLKMIRERDREIKAILDKHYPATVTLN